MAITASFSAATTILTVIGDSLGNAIAASRNAAGKILVNGGAVPVSGGTPTVANTALIQVFGQDGADTISLSEANGALPRANLFGGFGDDVLTGGSGGDQLFGQSENDTLLGKGGNDFLFGGDNNDTLTGGDGDDQMFGQAGDDRMIWNPGDDSDLMEGGDGSDIAEVNGGNGAETFTVTANGARVRFDRIDPAPFAIDIGTTESLVLNANGGDDTITAGNGLSTLIRLVIDGGAGNDTIRGGDGADIILGGDGNDIAGGGRGNDVAILGAGDDTFQWNPGDGNDTVEGQDGADTMAFNGANISENINIFANGGRVLFTRDIAAITMDLNDVERIAFNALGGADNITVNDLSATDVTSVAIDLRVGGGGDGQADAVTIDGGAGNEIVEVTSILGLTQIVGLATEFQMLGFESFDRLTLRGGAGNDTLGASTLAAGALVLTLDGGLGNDTLLGGAGGDTLLGGGDNDVLNGGAGGDIMQGGIGNDTYVVDNALDSFVEDFGQGIDTIRTAFGSFTLGSNFENLAFIGSGNFTGTGNGLNNTIQGGAGVDSLAGEAGNDILIGGAGGDTLVGGDLFDTASYSTAALAVRVALDGSLIATGDAAGDTFNGIEALSGTSFADALRGDAGVNRLIGEAGNDILQGQAGNDVIIGGDGIDTLAGGAANDRFDYTALTQGGDRIADFGTVPGNDDQVRFQSSVFGGLPLGTLDPSRFVANAEGLATAAGHRFVYETDTGVLRFDSNGSESGGRVVIATFSGLPPLAAADIFII